MFTNKQTKKVYRIYDRNLLFVFAIISKCITFFIYEKVNFGSE